MNAKPANLVYVRLFNERREASAIDTNITSQRFIEASVTKNWTVICHAYACYGYRFAYISLICIWVLKMFQQCDDFCSCCFTILYILLLRKVVVFMLSYIHIPSLG